MQLELTFAPPTLNRTELHAALGSEFARLNAAHFAGTLKAPEIVLSTRKTFGGYYQPRRHRIVVSWQAYLDHGWDEVLNTFRHEVAHIVHFNHSREFWNLALKLGATQRYAAPPLKRRARSHKLYTYACPACGSQITRRRRMKNISCARCDRRYNPKFAFRLISAPGQPPGGAGG